METRKGEYRVPSNEVITQCRSCQAEIIWTTTKGGKPIPLSVATVRVDEQGARWALNHFSDCPNARQHQSAPRHLTGRNGKPTNITDVMDDGAMSEAPTRSPASPNTVDLRDVHEYLVRRGLVVVGSTIRDNGNGRLIVELETRKA